MSFQMMGGVQGWNLTDVTIMLEVGVQFILVLKPVMREKVTSMLAIGIERMVATTAVGQYRFLGHNEWPTHTISIRAQ